MGAIRPAARAAITLSRRRVLSLLPAATAAAVIAACGGDPEATAEVAADPAEAPADDHPQEVAPASDEPAAAGSPAIDDPQAAADNDNVSDEPVAAGSSTSDDPHAADDSPSAAAEMPAAPEDTTLRFTTWHVSGPRGAAVRAALDGLVETHPWIFVEFVSPRATYGDWLARELASEQAPHVVLGDAAMFQQHRETSLLDIAEPLEKTRWQPALYHFIPDSYTDDGGNMSFPPAREATGSAFGVPYAITIDGWLMNESRFSQAGVPGPEAGWTWNDVVDTSKRLTDPEVDTWGVLAANSPEHFWIPLLFANGIERPFSVDGLSTAWFAYGDAASEAFEWGVDLIHESHVAPPMELVAELSAVTGDPFSAGFVALWPSAAVHATGYLSERIGEQVDWAVAPTPRSPTTGQLAHVWELASHFVTRQASHDGVVDAAVELGVHFASPDVQNRMGELRGSVPAMRSAMTTSAAMAPPPRNLLHLRDTLDDPRTRHLYTTFAAWPEWLQAQAQVAAAAFEGDLTPEEALIDMVRAGDAVLATQGGSAESGD